MTDHIADHNKMAQLPRELTAENGAKALLIGEFFEEFDVPNPDYCGCDDCDYCEQHPDEPEDLPQPVPVSWTTIKAIYAKIVEHFDKPATWHPIDPADESTLPGLDDADEHLELSTRDRYGVTWTTPIHSVLINPEWFTHWAPRIKQVPPKWEE